MIKAHKQPDGTIVLVREDGEVIATLDAPYEAIELFNALGSLITTPGGKT